MKTKITILICLFTISSFPFFGQPGTLDGAFDTDGKVTTAIGSSADQGYSVAIQPDGKILVAGFSYNGIDHDFALVRYNIGGSLDNTFGVDGKVTTAIGSFTDNGYSLSIQPDGKILVAGYSYNGTDNHFALVRYNTDGSLNNTFGVDGKVTTAIGSYSAYSYSVAVQPDGKILVAGHSDNGSDFDFAIARYSTDGSLDNTFGAGGKVITDMGSFDDLGWSVAIQPDGKILVAGFSWNGSDYDFALVRYNTNGSLDNTFSMDGKVTTGIGINDQGYSVAIQPDGKIVVAGYSAFGAFADFALVRYNTDGSLDNTFGGSGKITTDIAGLIDIGSSVAVQQDGKILVAGTAGKLLVNDDFALVRYNTDGTLDNFFGLGGKVTTDFGDTDNSQSVILQPDGKVLVAGYSYNGTDRDFAVARYLSGLVIGIIDFSTEDQSALIYPNPISNQATMEYSLTLKEKISIRLLDISGKVVKTFIDQEYRSEGDHREELNFPESISVGQYVLVIDNGSGNRSIKVIVQ